MLVCAGGGPGVLPHLAGEETEAREGGRQGEHPRKNQVPELPTTTTRISNFHSPEWKVLATSASDPRSAGSADLPGKLQENRLGRRGWVREQSSPGAPPRPSRQLSTSSPPHHLLPVGREGGERRWRQGEEALLSPGLLPAHLTRRRVSIPI